LHVKPSAVARAQFNSFVYEISNIDLHLNAVQLYSGVIALRVSINCMLYQQLVQL